MINLRTKWRGLMALAMLLLVAGLVFAACGGDDDTTTTTDEGTPKAGGVYKPKAFTPHEWATLRRLCDLIFPADGQSKGAIEAGAPEYRCS